jgi:hypothetical protein
MLLTEYRSNFRGILSNSQVRSNIKSFATAGVDTKTKNPNYVTIIRV